MAVANTTIIISINIIIRTSTVIVSFSNSSNNTIFGIKKQEGHEEELIGTILSYLATIEDKTKTFSELQKGKIKLLNS